MKTDQSADSLELRLVPLQQLRRWDRNPKPHDLGAMIESFQRYGFKDPPKFEPVLNDGAGGIVEGNGRWEALERLRQDGAKPPRGIAVDGDDWLVPVLFGIDASSQAEAEAYALDHNALTVLGGRFGPEWITQLYDEDPLKDVLAGLSDLGELPVSINGDDLDALIGTPIHEPQPNRRVDVDALMEEWGVKRGQVWGINRHRVTSGDCTDVVALASLMDGKKANGAFTSPPYAEQRSKQYGGIPVAEYVDWWGVVQSGVRDHMTVDGSFFINIKAHTDDGERSLYVMKLIIEMVEKWSWSFVDEFCWLRTGVPRQVKYSFKNGFEPVFHFAATRKGFKFRPESVRIKSDNVPIPMGPGAGATTWSSRQGNRTIFGKAASDLQEHESWIFANQKYGKGMAYPSNVLKALTNDKLRGHEAAFPVGLPEFFIRAFSDEGDLWFDPFLGSGTTMVAAERLGRVCYGMEIEPKYVAVTLQRMADMGLQPKLLNG